MRRVVQWEGVSDSQLLTIVLGGNAVSNVALRPLGELLDCRPAQLRRMGLAEAVSARVQAMAEISRRHQPRMHPRRPVGSARDALSHVSALRRLRTEALAVVLLDARMRCLETVRVAQGATAHLVATPKEVFAPAFARSASALVLAHNHPSGDPEPSDEDIAFTRTMRAAGELLDVVVLDHLVVAARAYTSFREAGLM